MSKITREKLEEYLKFRPKNTVAGPIDCFQFVKEVSTNEFQVPFPELEDIVDGLVNLDFEKLLPQVSSDELGFVTVSREDVKEGDFVNISNFNTGKIDHVGIMVNGEEFLHMGKYGPQVRKLRDILFRDRVFNFRRWVGNGKEQ